MPLKALVEHMQSGRRWPLLGIGCFLRWDDILFRVASKHYEGFWRAGVLIVYFTQVVLLEDIEDEVAETLKSKCPVGVFDIEDVANGEVFFFFLWHLFSRCFRLYRLIARDFML